MDKVKYYIRIKTHNTIVLRFWNKSDVKYFICVKLISYIQNHNLNNHMTITMYEYEKIYNPTP